MRGLGCPSLGSCQWERPGRAAAVCPRGSGLRKASEGSGVDICTGSEASLRGNLSRLRDEAASRGIGQVRGRVASLTAGPGCCGDLVRDLLVLNKFLVLSPDLLM